MFDELGNEMQLSKETIVICAAKGKVWLRLVQTGPAAKPF